MDLSDIESLSKDLQDCKVTVQSEESISSSNEAVSTRNKPRVDLDYSKVSKEQIASNSNVMPNTIKRTKTVSESTTEENLNLPTSPEKSSATNNKVVLAPKNQIRIVTAHSVSLTPETELELSSLYLDPTPSTSKAAPCTRQYTRTVKPTLKAHMDLARPPQESISSNNIAVLITTKNMENFTHSSASAQGTDLDQPSPYLDPIPSTSKASLNTTKYTKSVSDHSSAREANLSTPPQKTTASNRTAAYYKKILMKKHKKKLTTFASILASGPDLSSLFLEPITSTSKTLTTEESIDIITDSLARLDTSWSFLEPIVDVEPYTRFSNECFMSNQGVRPDLMSQSLDPTPSPNIAELAKRVPIHDISLHAPTQHVHLDLSWPFQQSIASTNKTVSSTIQLIDKLASLSHGVATPLTSTTQKASPESPIEYSYDCQAPMIYYKWPKLRSTAPSIFIHDPLALSDHVYAILAKNIKFYKPLMRKTYTKIVCFSRNDYNLMIEYLNSYDILYHTYTHQFHKFVKFILKGFPPDIDCSKLKKALLDASIEVRRLRKTKLIQGRSRNVIVEVTAAHQSKKLLWVKRIFGYKVTFEELTFVNQCKRCLRWDHSELTCRGELKCVWCGGKHLWNLCTFDISSFKVKCANCYGEHIADSKECSFCPLSKAYKALEITCEEIKVFEGNDLELVTMENCHELYGNLKYELNYANVPK